MKRKILLAITAIVVLICAVGVLVACNPKESEKPADNISRQTNAYFAGESEQFAVSIEVGKREKIFIADGKATDVEDFCQITITPLTAGSYEAVNYVVSGGENTLSGEITSSNYGEYTATVNLEFTPKTVTVTAGDVTSEIELANILEGALNSADVVNIAKEEFKDKLQKEIDEGKGEREIYVKLITGDRMTYYYYVSFIGDGVDYWAMLIDPKTGDVVSKR